jgi:hypothetical protein
MEQYVSQIHDLMAVPTAEEVADAMGKMVYEK